MQENYRLVGILNLFDVVPDFVYPIFEREGRYYFITGDEETLKTEGFEQVSERGVERIVWLSELKTNECKLREFNNESEPIFAFQVSETEVYIGVFKEIRDFLETFETDDRILKKEIKDFITNTGIKQI